MHPVWGHVKWETQKHCNGLVIDLQHIWTECDGNGEHQHEQGVRQGEPLHLHQDVSATRLPGGLETTLQVTSKPLPPSDPLFQASITKQKIMPPCRSPPAKVRKMPNRVYSLVYCTCGEWAGNEQTSWNTFADKITRNWVTHLAKTTYSLCILILFGKMAPICITDPRWDRTKVGSRTLSTMTRDDVIFMNNFWMIPGPHTKSDSPERQMLDRV